MNERMIRLCRDAGTEGIIMLKNEGALPLRRGERVSVFGRCQKEYYRSGTGSGGAVNVEYTTNLIDGLRKQREINVNEELARLYEEWITEHPFDDGNGEWGKEPWHQQEMEIEDDLARSAGAQSDKAIIVIGRTAGEDQDNAPKSGSYYLTETEKDILRKVTEYFDTVIVLLNVSNLIDMRWTEDPVYRGHIRAVLYVWQGGMEGGNSLVDILTGVRSPSRKLPDTIAWHLKDYPTTSCFGGAERNIYEEDIYVGYRYFETFCKDKVMYPFGFGMSYTDFEICVKSAKGICEDDNVFVVFEGIVKNTGTQYSGREVVQVYFEAPQGRMGKPKRELIRFCKTGELAPGHEEHFSFQISVEELSSYDDEGKTGYLSSYMLEKGLYRFYIGKDVRSAEMVRCFEEKQVLAGFETVGDGLNTAEDICVRSCREAMAPTIHFQRMRPGKDRGKDEFEILYESVPIGKESLGERILADLPEDIPYTGNKGINFQDVMSGNASLREFIAQFNSKELAILVRGEGMCSPKVTAGTASAFGGVAESIEKYGIPAVCTADGPSGIRMDNGAKASQLPIGTMLASTWNPGLIEELYGTLADEMKENRVDVLLGPGVNIHRNPLNGRNFEYFSEDPRLTGAFAAAAVRGLGKNGVYGTVKHFACNNQEYNRNRTDSIVSERALREIYLKGFELAVKEGKAKSVMTAYNPLNGHWCASNYDLCTTILRGEWGFDGIVMTDWWAKMNDPCTGGEPDMKNTAAMIRAQNDLYMVVTNGGAETNNFEDNTLEELNNGHLTVAELQRTAMNICRFILGTEAARRGPKVRDDETENDLFFKPVRFSPEDIEAELEIRMDGRYKFIVKLRSELSPLAQASTNLLLNDSPAATIQSGGTDGKWKILKLEDIFLKAGNYTMSLEERRKGLEICWIDVTK